MKIAIGADHRGVDFKQYVINLLKEMGYSYEDFGSFSAEAVDYPDIAKAVGESVAAARFDYGILICGTGIGMSIAANKIKGIRAALCCDILGARRARAHNDANIICLGAERGKEGVSDILTLFFSTPYEGGRHQRRLDKIHRMES
jgi:ribose 5-phosphate isomerase B